MSRVMKYDTIAIELRTSQKCGGGLLYVAYSPWKDYELFLTVKMETRHPVEGQFGREFPAICNHCGVMTA